MNWETINKNLYIISTIAFVIVLIVFLIISWLMQKKLLRKIFSTKNIAINSVLIALSVVLTNALGYSFSFGGGIIMLAFGNFLIFDIGMLFGPFIGMIGGIISDTIGALINNGGAYHFGFTLSKALFGFAGSLVFLFRNNKWLIGKVIIMFSLYFMIYSFVLSPISMLSLLPNKAVGAFYTISKLIRTPIELLIYIPLTITVFEILLLLLQKSGIKNIYIWSIRKAPVSFKVKKTLNETYKTKQNNNYDDVYIKIKSKH